MLVNNSYFIGESTVLQNSEVAGVEAMATYNLDHIRFSNNKVVSKNSLFRLNTPDFGPNKPGTNIVMNSIEVVNNEFQVDDNYIVTTAIILLSNLGHIKMSHFYSYNNQGIIVVSIQGK